MRSRTSSRRAFLGGPAALGITAYAAKAFSLNNSDDITTKITEIETIPLSIPVKPFEDGVDKTGAKAAPSKYYEGEPLERKRKRNEEGHLLMDYVFVKVHTDKGIIGMGEAPTDRVETLETVKFTIDRYMTPNLIGLNPFDIERNNEIVSLQEKNGRVIVRHATSAINCCLSAVPMGTIAPRSQCVILLEESRWRYMSLCADR